MRRAAARACGMQLAVSSDMLLCRAAFLPTQPRSLGTKALAVNLPTGRLQRSSRWALPGAVPAEATLPG